METNSRIEDIKKVGKQMQKACPVDIQLSHARTGLARALGFANWHALTSELQKPGSPEFQNRMKTLIPDSDHPAFSAAVERFSQSTGVEQDVAHRLCLQFLPSALEKWRNWRDNDKSISGSHCIAKVQEPAAPLLQASMLDPDSHLLAATVSNKGIRLAMRKREVPVVLRITRKVGRSNT